MINREGRLWITFYHQSKRHRRSLDLEDNKKNRKIAEQQLIPEIVYKLNNGMFFKETEKEQVPPSIGKFAYISFDIHKHDRRELTQKAYISNYERHIKPYFEKKRIDQVKPSMLAQWQNTLLDKVSSKTVKGIRTIFYTIMDDALRDEIIQRNPFTLVKTPKEQDVREKKPFHKEDMFKIIEAMPQSMQAFFALGFLTGMRTGELIGLKWIDIDIEQRTINVKRSRREGTETKPKTKSSIREIDMLDPLVPYLVRHKALKVSKEYVFETYEGKPFNTCDKISSHYWKKTLKKLNIPYRNLYQMRHSFASMMISHGEDILWVSNMLGHKDSSMTLQKYARYIKQSNKKRAEFLN